MSLDNPMLDREDREDALRAEHESYQEFVDKCDAAQTVEGKISGRNGG